MYSEGETQVTGVKAMDTLLYVYGDNVRLSIQEVIVQVQQVFKAPVASGFEISRTV